MISIYLYRNCYGYYCVSVALVQIPLILEVQHTDNTLNELLIKLNSTSPK